MKIWTDASTYPRNPGHIGLAYAADVDGCLVFGRAYGGFGTSNLGELLAIHFALDALRVQPQEDVTLYTDSGYSLKVLDGAWHWGNYGWLVRAIRSYGIHVEGLLIDLVRGHVGVVGNEQANWAAYQAAVYGSIEGSCPVYVIRDAHTRLLESKIIHGRRLLEPGLRAELDEVHLRVRHGKRNMDAGEQSVIQQAREALEEIYGQEDQNRPCR